MVREPDVRAKAGIRGIAMCRGMRHARNGNRYDGLCFFSIGPAGRESGNNCGRASKSPKKTGCHKAACQDQGKGVSVTFDRSIHPAWQDQVQPQCDQRADRNARAEYFLDE